MSSFRDESKNTLVLLINCIPLVNIEVASVKDRSYWWGTYSINAIQNTRTPYLITSFNFTS